MSTIDYFRPNTYTIYRNYKLINITAQNLHLESFNAISNFCAVSSKFGSLVIFLCNFVSAVITLEYDIFNNAAIFHFVCELWFAYPRN